MTEENNDEFPESFDINPDEDITIEDVTDEEIDAIIGDTETEGINAQAASVTNAKKENEAKDTGVEQKDWDYQERRTDARKKIDLKRTFKAEVILDTVQPCYVYIIDVSQGGMKIMTDLDIPEHRTFLMKLFLEETIELAVEIVWAKKMVGYMNVIGLRFVAMSSKAMAKIEAFIAQYSIDTTKRIVKLHKMLNMQIKKEEEWVNFYAFILNVSPNGLEFTTDYPLPENEFSLHFYLEQGQMPFEADVRVLFQREISLGRVKGWLEFSKMPERDHIRLIEYIDKTLQGDLPAKITAPIEGFSLDFVEIIDERKKKSIKKNKDNIESQEGA